MEHTIKLNKDNVLRLKIQTNEGIDTGEVLEFDLEDAGLFLKYQEMIEKNNKNWSWVRNQFLIIDKREDVKGKKLLSKNEEDKMKAVNEFFKKQTEVYNMFLGENGVQKILNGRSIGWYTFEEIDNIIEKQILPYVKTNIENIYDKIKNKYGNVSFDNKEQIEVIE